MASSQDAVAVYVELSAAIGQLQARGLHQSVKWAAEQLVGLPEEAWELGVAQAAKAAAQQQEPQHPRLVQGRNFFELKVRRDSRPPCKMLQAAKAESSLSPSHGRQPAGLGASDTYAHAWTAPSLGHVAHTHVALTLSAAGRRGHSGSR